MLLTAIALGLGLGGQVIVAAKLWANRLHAYALIHTVFAAIILAAIWGQS